LLGHSVLFDTMTTPPTRPRRPHNRLRSAPTKIAHTSCVSGRPGGASAAAVPEEHTAGARDALHEGLRAVWQQHHAEVLERLRLIERAVAASSTAELGEMLRSDARRSAHMLGGALAMFGFACASEAAHELELELTVAAPSRAATMSRLVATIRRELETSSIVPPGAEPARPHEDPLRVLVVDEDRELCERIAAASVSHDMLCDRAAGPCEARASWAEHPPAIVLLGLSDRPQETAEAYALLSDLSAASPPIPVLVLTRMPTFEHRVEAARRGSRGFLPKSLTPDEVWSAVERFLDRDRLEATRVLVVDDDPTALDSMRVLLAPADLEVFTLADPLRFWETLEEVEPELLILDVDMPGVNGPELCRTVRNDPGWGGLAVIFASGRTDADTVGLAFEAGADDYVAKPFVGPELVARVSNRLRRVRLYRARAETDGLTGLSNRAASEEGLKRLAEVSERSSEPLAVVMLDIDHFKLVNDTHSHAAGDRVLRRVGACLRREFRGDGVVGRWGGEEFIVGLYGVTRASAVGRLTDMQARLSKEEFPCREGAFHISFSAGVAEYPLDGDDTDAVCQAADEALYRAKAAGRARVLASGTPSAASTSSRARTEPPRRSPRGAPDRRVSRRNQTAPFPTGR
jgi:diguanylate cyclase (GGDEF)-like protein